MSAQTSIEWTDRTWSPVRGCTRVSEGCRNCYAERMVARFPWGRGFAAMTSAGPRWTGRVDLVPHALAEPLSWRVGQKVFISTTDIFHEALSDEDVGAVIGAMAAAWRQTFQVLTKRPRSALDWFRWYEADRNPDRYRHPELIEHAAACAGAMGARGASDRLHRAANERAGLNAWPLPNLWLGVSVEDQATADERIPLLLETPAAVRFVSYEPALGPVDFTRWMTGSRKIHVSADAEGALRNRSFAGLTADDGRPLSPADAEAELRALMARGVRLIPGAGCDDFDPDKGCRGHRNPRLSWVIVGGESGPGARPFEVAWARSTVEQCRAAGVPVFVKQLGSHPIVAPGRQQHWEWGGAIGREARFTAVDPQHPSSGPWRVHLEDRKGGDMEEWSAYFRVREFPAVPR
jgi:protein gp37